MALSKILNASVTDGTLTTTKLATPNLGRRNLIINGAMQVAQRGTNYSPVTSNAYTLDRWQVYKEAGAINITQAVDVPSNLFKFSFKSDVATAATGATPGLNCYVHKIEGNNIAHLGWGTSNAKSIAISFWVKSTKTGIFTVAIKNSAQDRAYPAEYTINVSNTWEYKSIIIAGDTSGTWLNTSGKGIQVIFTISADSTRRATGNAWGAGNIYASTNQVNGVDNVSNNWLITGVQMEVGSVATPFEHRSYGEELPACQRYFIKTNPEDATRMSGFTGVMYSTTQSVLDFVYPVEMRAAATSVSIGGTNNNYWIAGINGAAAGTVAATQYKKNMAWWELNSVSGGSPQRGHQITYSGQVSINAEL
tara:strand:- start:125 stop:1216 length:1092 start_codon:yes stop_codon:yes gene_type:complete